MTDDYNNRTLEIKAKPKTGRFRYSSSIKATHKPVSTDCKVVEQSEQMPRLWGPRGLDMADCLGARLARQADPARYVIHLVLMAGQGDDNDTVYLSATRLRKYFTDNAAYLLVVEALERAGWLERSRSYTVGKHTKAWRPSMKLKNMPKALTPVSNAILAKKIMNDRRERTSTPLDRYLADWLNRIEIDYSGAMSEIHSTSGKLYDHYQTDAVQLIHEKAFRFDRCKYGRVHTNMTLLDSRLRRFLSFSGHDEPLVNLDIRNSQPLMFTLLLKKQFPDDMPTDVQDYIRLCELGRFYDNLMEETPDSDMNRGDFKREFFRAVFFGPNRTAECQTSEAFGRLFPAVFQAIRQAKADEYQLLARNLQRAESELMIDGVCGRLMKDLPAAPVFTIHDSIVTTRPFQEPVREIILQEFAKQGIHPTINPEPLNHPKHPVTRAA